MMVFRDRNKNQFTRAVKLIFSLKENLSTFQNSVILKYHVQTTSDHKSWPQYKFNADGK